jgi:hypothetical protein
MSGDCTPSGASTSASKPWPGRRAHHAPAVQHQGEEQAEADEDRRRHRHEHRRVQHGAQEALVRQKIRVVLEADEAIEAAEHIVVLEAQPQAEPDRQGQQHDEQQDVGQHEQDVTHRRAANARRRRHGRHRRWLGILDRRDGAAHCSTRASA